MPISYKSLLRKYMSHVRAEEGITFIDRGTREFTEAELAVLVAMSDDVNGEFYREAHRVRWERPLEAVRLPVLPPAFSQRTTQENATLAKQMETPAT